MTISGDFRPRFEVRRYDASESDTGDWNAIATQRSRLGSKLTHRNGTELDLALQDVRTWGSTGGSEAALFEVHVASVMLPVTQELSLVIGRQELDVGHERIIGIDDFSQRGRSLDALRLNLTMPPAEAYAFYANIQEGPVQWSSESRLGRHEDRGLGGVVSRISLIANHRASILFAVDGDRAGGSTRYTFGGIVGGHQSVVHYSAEAYGQSGVEQHDTVKAYFLGTRAQVTGRRRFTPSVALWLDHASGGGSRRRSFDAPLGSPHEYFGALDLFVDLPADTAFGGITDFGASAGGRPIPSVLIAAHWHHFSTRTSSNRASVGLLGQEVGATTTVELSDFASLEALAATFFPAEGFDDLRVRAVSPTAELGGWLCLRARF